MRRCVLLTFLVASMVFCHAASSGAFEFGFKNPQYYYQFLRALAYAPAGGSDIGECLETASRIKEGDDESWYAEWLVTADRVRRMAQDNMDNGRQRSASAAFLRASNYYRTAEFFLRATAGDPRALAAWKASRECFLKAIQTGYLPVTPVRIPYENTTLPGYYCVADNTPIKHPLLIVQTGFDGTAEELYAAVVKYALPRGYNCLIFEGPGQGAALREQKLHFRPDWEKVVTPVVDYALTLPQVNPEKIALMGLSFGGFFVPRALAFEHRVKVGIANGGVWDFHANVMRHLPPDAEKVLDDVVAAAKFDQSIFEIMREDAGVRWAFGQGMWTFGVSTPTDWLRATRPYTMKDVAAKIKCRMLIVDSEGDRDMPGQAAQLFAALKCPKEYMLFRNEEGAGEHCQVGAVTLSNERILDWLDDAFGRAEEAGHVCPPGYPCE